MAKTPFSRLHLGIIAGFAVVIPALVFAAPTADTAKTPEAPASHAAHVKAAPDGPNKAVDLGPVHNAYQWTDRLISGSCPYGDAGFKALAQQGIKTIITVDGALPDLNLAKKYGMRYVHIPVEYSGIAEQDALKIARAVRDLPGPIFLHCHHGIHRGPAAAALAAIALGKLTNEQATAGLKQSGTGANYKGLWNAVRDFKQPTGETLDKVDNTFPEKATVAAMAAAMVNIDNRWEHLREVKAANWSAPKDHPDIDPAHEALLLRESYRELQRSKAMDDYPVDMRTKMSDAEIAAAALEAALRAKDNEKAATAFTAVQASCSSCHKLYRDNVPAN
jgi:protein tyrosine phosphatase (PTP) superfamily phosphohydrolase (DUF442 family)